MNVICSVNLNKKSMPVKGFKHKLRITKCITQLNLRSFLTKGKV